MTETLRAQKAIIEAKEKAEESNRLKTSFLANMSHELRTPMVGILGFSEILIKKVKMKKQKQCLKIYFERQRLMETLNLILDISRVEAGGIALNYEYIDIVKVAKEVVNTFEIMAKKRSLYLNFISKEKSILSRLDERLVRQILNNLVINAIKYTEKWRRYGRN